MSYLSTFCYITAIVILKMNRKINGKETKPNLVWSVTDGFFSFPSITDKTFMKSKVL